MSDEFVEVVDLTFVTTTPGLTLNHTLRFHEGDAMSDLEGGGIRLHFGPKDVTVGNARRKLPGRRVTIQGQHIVEMTNQTRIEKRIRPSAQALLNREKAEIDDRLNEAEKNAETQTYVAQP